MSYHQKHYIIYVKTRQFSMHSCVWTGSTVIKQIIQRDKKDIKIHWFSKKSQYFLLL